LGEAPTLHATPTKHIHPTLTELVADMTTSAFVVYQEACHWFGNAVHPLVRASLRSCRIAAGASTWVSTCSVGQRILTSASSVDLSGTFFPMRASSAPLPQTLQRDPWAAIARSLIAKATTNRTRLANRYASGAVSTPGCGCAPAGRTPSHWSERDDVDRTEIGATRDGNASGGALDGDIGAPIVVGVKTRCSS
jgi:hypothetical protein